MADHEASLGDWAVLDLHSSSKSVANVSAILGFVIEFIRAPSGVGL